MYVHGVSLLISMNESSISLSKSDSFEKHSTDNNNQGVLYCAFQHMSVIGGRSLETKVLVMHRPMAKWLLGLCTDGQSYWACVHDLYRSRNL